MRNTINRHPRMAGLLACGALFVAAVVLAQDPNVVNYFEQGGARWVVGGSLDVVSGGDLDIESGGSIKIAGTAVTASAAELNALTSTGLSSTELGYLNGVTAGTSAASKAVVLSATSKIDAIDITALTINGTALGSTATELDKLDGVAATAYVAVTDGVSFAEDGSGTSYVGTVEIPAGAVVHDICFTSTVLWDGTSASLTVGDDDAADAWFGATNLKATDLLVGEVLCAADDGTWGGLNGAYLTPAGRRGRVTAGVDSGWYYGAASEVIFTVTPGAADGSAGRSFGWVTYSVPTFTASTNT